MGVSIYESAIKPSVDLEDSVNVYVPGYSTIGPEEPTLCSSVSEFESLFGSSPYLFESAQLTGSNTAIAAGSPEKGYLYAKALLNVGLKVLFHRVKPASATTAKANIPVDYGTDGEYVLVAQAISFGKSYNGIKVKLTKNTIGSNLFTVEIKEGDKIISTTLVSFDPTSSIYIKLMAFPLIQFKALSNTDVVDIEDSIMLAICKAGNATIDDSETASTTGLVGGGPQADEFGVASLLAGLADGSLLKPLLDFERYPSVTYLTSGGYFLDSSPGAANKLIEYADKVKAVSVIDFLGSTKVTDATSWGTYQSTLSGLTGTDIAKGKSTNFIGCNSFNLSPYRVLMGDSLNYLVSLGNNINKNIKPWLPVANDPNGVAGIGYDTTNKITTDLAEIISEGNTGVSSNAIIYSKSAGGYKIMGNRTLRSNDGVLSPNSFLNIAVIVNKVERSCRQTANKLKIVSTNPRETFNKFEESVSKTINPMVVNQDGVLSYKIRMLPKTKPATIEIEIHLVVLEGIEQFNIYIPYELSLD